MHGRGAEMANSSFGGRLVIGLSEYIYRGVYIKSINKSACVFRVHFKYI